MHAGILTLLMNEQIVMCLLVTRAPSSNLATSCMEELVSVESLFTLAARHCQAAANTLVRLSHLVLCYQTVTGSYYIMKESIKKLRIKGKEALDQSQSSDPSSLSPAELDRLGGKTHLISGGPCLSYDDASSSTTASSNSSSPSSSSLAESGPMPTDFIMNVDNLHSRIVQDMKAFEGFDMSMYNYNENNPFSRYLFDAPPPALLDPQTMTQDAGIYGVDLFPFMAERLMQQQYTYQQDIQPQPQPQNMGEQPMHSIETQNTSSPGPTVLDTTWQTFVEQLGF